MERSMTADRLVVVPAALLDDLLELARLAVDRLDRDDPLRSALAGSVGAVRTTATLEP